MILMSKIVDEVVAANKKYASGFGAKKDLALPPARGFAILTCMDARLDPAKYAGLAEGTHMSFVTPAGAPLTTPSARW
jgi:carbonic anhydrase